VIQTEPNGLVMNENNAFKDDGGVCWKFIGQFNTRYIAPIGVDTLTYTGNYFRVTNPYVYTNCTQCLQVAQANPCLTQVYFNMTRCDDGTEFIASACDLMDSQGNSLLPTSGSVVVVNQLDTNGNVVTLFCANVINQTEGTTPTNFSISIPPQNSNYICNTCPIYYKYTISTCNNDGSAVVNFPMYSQVSVGLLPVGTVVSVAENLNCWTIVTQEGMVEEPSLGTLVLQSLAYTYLNTYSDCNGCLSAQSLLISKNQSGTNPYDPNANVGSGGGTRDLYLSPTGTGGEFIVIKRVINE
jgi:hypothetical protein